MCKIEGAALKLVQGVLGPIDTSKRHFASLSSGEWMISIALEDTNDRRFRYTRGNLFDEATIGDARV